MPDCTSQPLASRRLTITTPSEARLAYEGDALHDTHTNARRALVSVHGSCSPAVRYRERAGAVVRAYHDWIGTSEPSGAADREIVVVAPQLATLDSVAGLPPNVLRWSSPFHGADAENAGHPSSFLALDRVLQRLCDRDRFPKLERIVLVGHSGGGQILNRYAAVGDAERLFAEPIGVHVRYVLLNPGSYLYFDNQRMDGDDETTFEPTSPAPDLVHEQWGYGCLFPVPYVADRGLEPNEIRDLYAGRDVVHLAGSDDDDPDHDSLPGHPAAKAQGAHRLQRSRVYVNYLAHLHGADILRRQQHAVVAGAGHSGGQMMRRTTTRRLLLEDFTDAPTLRRLADSGRQAGAVGRVVVARRRPDPPGVGDAADFDRGLLTAVRDSGGLLRLVGWELERDGTWQRTQTATSTHPADLIDMARVDAPPSPVTGGPGTPQHVTGCIAPDGGVRLATWRWGDGGLQQLREVGPTVVGAATALRTVALDDEHLVVVRRTVDRQVLVATWALDSGGRLTHLDEIVAVADPTHEVTAVHLGGGALVVASTTPSDQLRLTQVRVSLPGSVPGALAVEWDRLLPVTGTDLCADTSPSGLLLLAFRAAPSQRLRLATYATSPLGPERRDDSGDQVGEALAGVSMRTVPRVGIATLVRTRSGRGRLIHWRTTPGGRIRRVADSRSTLGAIGREHDLVGLESWVALDLALAVIDEGGSLRMVSYRAT